MKFVNFIQKEINSEFFYNVLFFSVWASVLYNFVWGISLHVPKLASVRDEFLSCIFIFLTIGAIPFLVKRINALYIFIYVCLVIAYQTCYLLFPENTFFLDKEKVLFLCQVVPLFFLGLCFECDEKKMNVLFYIAVISIVLSFVYNIILQRGVDFSISDEKMVASYRLVPNLLVIVSYMIKQKKKAAVIPLLCGLFLIFSYGTRGPLVVCVLYCFILILYFLHKGDVRRFALIFGLILLAYVGIISYMEQFIDLVEKAGMSTRIFQTMFLADKIDSNGRDFIYEQVKNSIDFIHMHGFAGDRFLLNGTYSHNFFLEMWYSFGLFGGSILILFLFIIIVLGLIYAREQDVLFLIVLISFVFGQLFFSGSFMHQGWLYFLIGYSISIISKEKKTSKPLSK